jgi:putative PIN family toxin of toxin-antitoxin system
LKRLDSGFRRNDDQGFHIRAGGLELTAGFVDSAALGYSKIDLPRLLWYDIQYQMRIVIDTNVIISALRSSRGTSYKLISLLPSDRFSIAISVPLVFEYEGVLRRSKLPEEISEKDISDFIDFLCYVAFRQDIFFLWRPFLPDPSDDLVLEVAVEASCDSIITYNKRHFPGIEKFGIRILDPKEFLAEIGVIS